ncbi:ATP synthase subunit K like protein [Verticillium longisporum]|uniref:ATP synthase subunit K like protein n=1 Tax=Verticillium longisporum TaxID=100787 RepID=A0A8I2Z798_VERLO|nr:ATP synthase subunit K like protein [Verticillium longisporum]KAG7111932.1 ATP synthase subunit K like protein [Verticillium longisporum]KAG7112679.1 ATP synthase subunit K like protein [Verticillium longisporum]KAG7144354.1 ATP synthase subunit K like protein [Verticillium longisporum]
MVQMYSIAGRQIGSHYLAIGVLATLFTGSYVSLSGGSKAPAATPPINASSSDEADFIKKFLDSQEKDAKKH